MVSIDAFLFGSMASLAMAQNFDPAFGSHGAMTVTIAKTNLKVGETATIIVIPFQHVQYTGCCMWGQCPEICGGMKAYFIPTKGCQCDPKAITRTALVDTTYTGAGAVDISDIVAAGVIGNSVGSAVDGKITVTATKPGKLDLTVVAIGHNPLSYIGSENIDLVFWKDVTEVFQITVTE